MASRRLPPAAGFSAAQAEPGHEDSLPASSSPVFAGRRPESPAARDRRVSRDSGAAGTQTDMQEIRRESLRRLVQEYGGMTALAKLLGHARGSFISQLLSDAPPRPISEKSVRKWERMLTLPPGWMDGTVKAPVSVDTRMLRSVIEAATEALSSSSVRLDAARFAELIASCYGDALAVAAVDISRIASIVGTLRE